MSVWNKNKARADSEMSTSLNEYWQFKNLYNPMYALKRCGTLKETGKKKSNSTRLSPTILIISYELWYLEVKHTKETNAVLVTGLGRGENTICTWSYTKN